MVKRKITNVLLMEMNNIEHATNLYVSLQTLQPLNCRTLFSVESKPPHINIYRPAVRSSRSVSILRQLTVLPPTSQRSSAILPDTPNIKNSARQKSKIYYSLTIAIQKITSCIVKNILHVPCLAVVLTPQTASDCMSGRRIVRTVRLKYIHAIDLFALCFSTPLRCICHPAITCDCLHMRCIFALYLSKSHSLAPVHLLSGIILPDSF